MVETREQEQVDVLGFIWARNETTGNNMRFLVAMIWGKVHNHLNVDPTVGLLAGIKLRSVDQEKEGHVVVTKMLSSLDVVCTVNEVLVGVNAATVLEH